MQVFPIFLKGVEKVITQLKECLENKNANYILPFFWQHGESENVLRTYMNAISNANIREVCLEACPHPDHAGGGVVSGCGCDSG